MTAKTDAMENGMLLLFFNNTNFANIGDATGLRGSVTAGSFYWSLHTADPGEAGNQSTNETTYTSYARQASARASGVGGFNVTANSVSPGSNLNFPTSTAGTPTITHAGIGVASVGATTLLYKGAVTPNIVVSTSVNQVITTSSTLTED